MDTLAMFIIVSSISGMCYVVKDIFKILKEEN
ncbi:hypothetical protein H3019_gp02 [Bacillus phage Karezi]|uniref:Uncharacterized protein n=1 Tax=Bacillus phage Karezi TaxID=2591398 RepID=A0A514AAS8_9CAUD|nr:hypothetical protein H3019_gp02 [Bacillus phage Karezi]QDH50355.1 hypothetical protein KAREZI_2 [Bacillus phage Karezi]